MVGSQTRRGVFVDPSGPLNPRLCDPPRFLPPVFLRPCGRGHLWFLPPLGALIVPRDRQVFCRYATRAPAPRDFPAHNPLAPTLAKYLGGAPCLLSPLPFFGPGPWAPSPLAVQPCQGPAPFCSAASNLTLPVLGPAQRCGIALSPFRDAP